MSDRPQLCVQFGQTFLGQFYSRYDSQWNTDPILLFFKPTLFSSIRHILGIHIQKVEAEGWCQQYKRSFCIYPRIRHLFILYGALTYFSLEFTTFIADYYLFYKDRKRIWERKKERKKTHTCEKKGSDKFNLLKIRDKVTQINFNNLL